MVLIDFINVGYGDAVLLQFLSDQQKVYRILIDCGDIEIGDKLQLSDRIRAADYLSALKVDTLDLVIISHLHLDHAGGLLKVAKTVRIRELWTNYLPPAACWNDNSFDISVEDCGAQCLVKALNALCKALCHLKKAGCRIRCVTDNHRLSIPGREDCKLELHAAERMLFDKQKTIFDHVCSGIQNEAELHSLDLFINNTSLRTIVSAEGKKVFLPGDACGEFLEYCGCLPCDLLKIPHHGHLDGITEKLLAELHPEYAVISVSDDRTDDCPSPALLDLLKKTGASVSFTDAVHVCGIAPEHHRAVRYELRPDGIFKVYVKF